MELSVAGVRVVTPNPIDAISGGDVTIEGSNFGIEENDIEIYVEIILAAIPREKLIPSPKIKIYVSFE